MGLGCGASSMSMRLKIGRSSRARPRRATIARRIARAASQGEFRAGARPRSSAGLRWPPGRRLFELRGRSSEALGPVAALSTREQVLYLAYDAGAVERDVDLRGADERALGCCEGALHIVDGEKVL